MKAVEIEEAVSALATEPFDPDEFPYAFIAAFGNKDATIKRLRATGKSSTNKSDVQGGVLQRLNIHLAIAERGKAKEKLEELLVSPATTKHKCKFVLATDGDLIHAQNLLHEDEPPRVCHVHELGDHFNYFLELAGISTVKAIRESGFDIKATKHLNRLYVELLRHNEGWDTLERRQDLNHFFARLIFCFFAEDTGIFKPAGDGEIDRTKPGIFTATVQQMTEPDGSNTAMVLSECFRAMNTPIKHEGKLDGRYRKAANIRSWADIFPYVNGGLFEGAGESSGGGGDVPQFTKIARSYLLHIGSLDWTKINPDIFGSMIQAVADDEERGALGMHYTSVPNILKVLNPLFLDDLREKLDQFGDPREIDDPKAAAASKGQLKRLRDRIARIRVFDPACGSGNFLVIAYKQMRAIEAEINARRGEQERHTDIPLTNFRGIELRHFAAEVARLALIIAEYQCDAEHRGQRLALAEFLPLDSENWITHGNALRLDWLSICPPTGTETEIVSEHMFEPTQKQARIDFQNEGGETYICGNPPYVGTKYQNKENKADLAAVFQAVNINVGNADYVLGWLYKAGQSLYQQSVNSFAFVSTSSLFQGEQAELILWLLERFNLAITFAHRSFTWTNNAANNAGVTCCIAAMTPIDRAGVRIITDGENAQSVTNIGPYLVNMPSMVIRKTKKPISSMPAMGYGSMANDAGHLMLSRTQYHDAIAASSKNADVVKRAVGGADFIRGETRYTLYVPPKYALSKEQKNYFSEQIESVRESRSSSKRAATQKLASVPHQYAEPRHTFGRRVFIPQTLSGNREYVTGTLLDENAIVIAPHMQIVNGGAVEFSIISSRLHLIWIDTVCGKLKTDYRYSNTLGWNTFPVLDLTDENKAELTRRAEDILLAREFYWPATIADMYDPKRMDDEFPEVRAAHDRNDETLERIYIGRRFKNDTERLEKLFEMYTDMTAADKQ